MRLLEQLQRSLRVFGTRRSAHHGMRPARSYFRPTLDELESRWLPSGVSLGAAANYAVLGLQNTQVVNSNVTISGNEAVSQGGTLKNMAPSTITGNAYEYTQGQYSGPGKLGGSVLISPGTLSQADADALSASSQANALGANPTQTFGNIDSSTTVAGNGGLNVIDINGSINSSLILSGSASDVFIVNVTGSVNLVGNTTLGLGGGVTADHVLYNFTGASGSIDTHVGNVLNGTLLAPTYSFNLDGTFNGEIIGGGRSITLLSQAHVNYVPFSPPVVATASLSGSLVSTSEVGLAGYTVILTNSSGVSITETTDANGSFSFTNLAPDTYTLTYLPGSLFAISATPGGTAANPSDGNIVNAQDISQIVLNSGDDASNYQFEAMLVTA